MRRFRSKEKIRDRLLQGVYEQNLSILENKTASRKRRRFPFRPGIASAMFLGALLFGQTLHLSPFPWGSEVPLQSPAAWPPRDGKVEPLESALFSDSEITPGSFGESTQTPVGPDSSAAEYRSLAQGDNLRIKKVFGLGVKTIMIDPGHGGPSATGAIGKGGTAEKSINLDIAKKLRAVLERDTEYRILMVREDDRDVPLKDRVKLANEAKADLFISIHVNALPSNPIDIIETYYFGPTRDTKTLELAAEVNEGSDYSYSEYNEVIKEITNQLKFQESRRLAQSIQDALYLNMKKRKADVRNFGVKRAPFVVLLGVEMPAVLLEVGCLSNGEEENRLKDAAYRQSLAGYIEAGIIRYLDENKKRSRAS
jgi:N-acetylmuramoyl-L-alanine amidase